ncbi:MAG: hypothetical protein DWQ41_08085 [Planctomycetota bacterium]|nr:MAG: hypothetical protein DWQ41_08085 [Planctomycetota bacterium]
MIPAVRPIDPSRRELPKMPVKIRCRGCEKVLAAPDKAKGRVIQCPKCGTKLKVPGGPAKSKTKARAKAPAAPKDPDDFLAGVDLTDLEHEEERICPFCAAEMDEEETICRACGMNTETGRMDAREAKKRARKGPDPALFYSKAWSDSWAFMLEHWRLAVRTGWYLASMSILVSICSFMVAFCEGGPTKFFWFCLTALSFFGMLGWVWHMTYKVIESTMTRDEKLLDRVHFDLFAVISLGLRFVLWPWVVLIPSHFVVGAVFILMLLTGMIAAEAGSVEGFFASLGVSFILMLVVYGSGLLFCLLAYPLATVHLTQKYTYKAWILWELLKIILKNFGPACYFFVVALVVALPALILAIPVIFALLPTLNPFSAAPIDYVTGGITSWILELAGESGSHAEAGGWLYRLIIIPLNLIAALILLAPFWMAAAFPITFIMRVNGLLGHYNRERLGLVNFIKPDTPANFWPRVLAHLIDGCLWPLASLLTVKEPKALIGAWVLNAITLVCALFLEAMLPFVALLWQFYMYWMYFAVNESQTTRTTIGKDAFGLIVSDVNGKQLTLGKASMRVFGRVACGLTLGLGYLLVAFTPEKRGLHDMLAGTKVTWRGDR